MWRFCVLLLLIVTIGTASAGPLAKIYICPSDVTLNYKVQHQFQVFGLDAEGNVVEVPGPITWSANSTAGTITSTGLFTASATSGTYLTGVTVSASTFTATAVVIIGSPASAGGYLFEKSWGGYGPGHVNEPQGVAVDANGNVYVADTSNNRIQVFDANGTYKKQWGSRGLSNGQFNAPLGLAIDKNGYLYVADSGNGRIQKFDLNGNYISKVGSPGTDNGKLSQPGDVDIDSSGNIYVADTGNNRIQKFSSSGAFVTKWGSLGTAEGQFNTPKSLALDSSGNLYVADCNNNRVQIFSTTGTFISSWGHDAQSSVVFNNPGAIDVDAYNNVYVADYSNRIQKLNTQGTYITQYTPQGQPLGQTLMVRAIASANGGYIYVADASNNSIKKLDPTGIQITFFGSCWDQNGQFNRVDGVALDRWGEIYATDWSGAIQAFNSSGTFLRRWRTWGSGVGQPTMPKDIAISPDDELFVVDTASSNVKKFDLLGNLITEWGTRGNESGQFVAPCFLDVDAKGNVYVTDHTRRDIQKFSSDGQFLAGWIPGGDDRQITATCVAPDGTIYVGDAGHHTVWKFDKNGHSIGSVGTPGTGDNQLWAPRCVELDPSGNLYVADNSKIKVFNTAGSFVKCFGTNGTGIAEFDDLEDMQFDVFGNLYIADLRGNRISKFVPVDGSLGLTKYRRDGDLVSLSAQVVTAGSSELGDCFYVESEDRSCGIKVTGKTAVNGTKVAVKGILATLGGEREIQATSVTNAGSGTVDPVVMNNNTLGGGDALLEDDSETGQHGMADGVGLNNIGLLVRTTGLVTYAGYGFFYIDDGSGINDGSVFKGVRVLANGFYIPPAGTYVQVTGISSCFRSDGRLQRLIRTRSADDMKLLSGVIVSGKLTKGGGVVTTLVESAHPYRNNLNYTWTVTGPSSATNIRVRFSRLDMEYNHDYLYLKNAAGTVQTKYNTPVALSNYWSQWVAGNTVQLQLVSDVSGTAYGFQVDAYQVEGVIEPVSGATITAIPGNVTTETDLFGNFTLFLPEAGTYTLTPSLGSAVFSPASLDVTLTEGQILKNVNFMQN